MGAPEFQTVLCGPGAESDVYDWLVVDVRRQANKGLFVGLFIASVMLVAISSYFVFNKGDDDHGNPSNFIYFGTELGLLVVLFGVVVAAGVKLRRLRFVGHVAGESPLEQLDRSLLVVAVFAVLVLECFHLVSALLSVATGIRISAIWVVISVISIAQVSTDCAAELLRSQSHCADTIGTVLVPWTGNLFCSCSLAVVDPRVGHTMDVLSPFIPVLCHSD